MSQKRPTPKRSATTRNGKASQRNRRLGLISTIVVVVAVIGVVLTLHFISTSSSSSPPTNPRMGTPQAVGLAAPDGTFKTTTGQQLSIASLRGKPTLIWFVATWCSSCQAGTHAMAVNLPKLSADGVRVVEIELYKDLGQPGSDMATFGKALAGSQYSNPDWVFATSSKRLTQVYDPKSYLDIYYLINSKGQITYIDGSPASTMASLLTQASSVT